MADYHLLNDGVFGVGGSDIMEETANLVNAGSYSHPPSVNSAGQGMMPQSMQSTPGQNPNVMMPGMVPMQQGQGGTQMSTGGMSSYHQGAMHGYQQNEVPQKLHQYSVYGSQLQSSNMTGQYVSGGPRLHHLNDPLSSIPDQPQQSSPRTVVPNQMYQNRSMSAGHYGQQMSHNPTSAQMNQGSAQYAGHYGSVQHHPMQQHAVQQVNQNPDLWQNSMGHSQMARPCLPASQSYSQHQMVPNQHAAASLNHSPMAMQGQRASTPNQSQYLSNQEYAASLTANQQTPMQRPPVYNMNSSSVTQNGSMVGQLSATSQSGMSQNLNSMSQTEQSMTYTQGHYGVSQSPANRPHYNAVGSNVGHPTQQHVMGQQMMNVRASAHQTHQIGYSPVPSRVNSGQQHAPSVPPGSPARLQQYHSPFSPNQAYSTQPSPRPANPESATPPHLHYSSSQHAQAPMSPQYRTPFSSQVTHSPQHLTSTPPAEVSVPPALTPERVLQSSTPQSQGSYHSPSTTHLTSPGQGHSPGNSNAPSSLQHLEQMVLPRVSTGPSVTPTPASVSPGGTNTGLSHNSGISGNYYSHLSSAQHTQPPQQQHTHSPQQQQTQPLPQPQHTQPLPQPQHTQPLPQPQHTQPPQQQHAQPPQQQHTQPPQQQHTQPLPQQQHTQPPPQQHTQPPPQQQPQPPPQHHMLLSSVSDARPQPQSPAFTHVSQAHSHHTFINQPHSVGQLPSPTMSNVPSSSQPLQPSTSTIPNLSNSTLMPDETTTVDSNQHNALSYGSDSNSSLPSAGVSDSSVSRSMPVPAGSLTTSDQIAPQSSSANSASDSLLPPSHQYNMLGKAPYQGSTSSITFEMQQIQQELQQLYGMHQSPEIIEKIKVLQEQLRYMSSQQSASNTTSISSNATPMSPHYQRPMLYNSGNTAPYMHQPMMQPHSVHYTPQASPANAAQEIPQAPVQQNITTSLPTMPSESVVTLPEQGPLESDNMASNHYPTPSLESVPPPLTIQDKPELPPDPYEMNFADEPPPKMKRRPPKEPKAKKSPKTPKTPKSPKPKKPKKAKKSDEIPHIDPFQSPTDNLMLSPEPVEGQSSTIPLEASVTVPTLEGEQVPATAEASVPKPKKARKRKPKDSDGEPKEPKPKKPRKRPEKKPKQPKVAVEETGEIVPNDGNNNSIDNGDKPLGATPDADGTPNLPGDDEAKENVDITDKEVKEKKPKSKSPKASKEGTPKEPKKSTPKKKLPKIALRFTSKKKKKKPLAVSDHSDIEKTPPPSPVDDGGTTKRRSARNTERKKYTDDIELHLSDDETIEMDFGQRQDGRLVQVVVDTHNEDYMVVEKILSVRTVKKQLENTTGSDADAENTPEDTVEEYYVKYKNLSYIHCDWKTLEELEKGDRRFIQKVKRFKQKKETFNFFDFLEEDPFNPDYIEVDRVLDVNVVKEVISADGEATIAPPSPKHTEANMEPSSPKKEPLSPKGEPSSSKDEPSSPKDEPSSPKDEPSSPKDEPSSPKDEPSSPNDEPSSPKDEPLSPKVESSVSRPSTPEGIKSEELNSVQMDTDVKALESAPQTEEIPSVKSDTDDLSSSVIIKTESKELEKECLNDADAIDAKVEEGPTDEIKPEEDSESKPVEDAESKPVEGGEIKLVGDDDKLVKDSELVKDGDDKSVIKEENIRISRHYLVKWRALTYEESTWELEDDVDRDKIEQFLRFKDPPPKDKWKVKKRPRPAEWNQIEDSPVYKGGNTLREYQLEGVNWLTFCWYNSQNCILADEMGLGKTIQSITFLNEIDLYGIPGPFLVIAPLSTIGNWQREFETWTDINAITYHGSSPSRNMILEYEMYWKNKEGERIQDVYKFQVMITTFEIILTDCMELKAIPWRCVIIDEAHRLKNRNCKLLEGLRMLNTEHRVLLTGTPLQNNVEELFSLLNFLEPNRFASTEAFLEEFGNLKTESQVDKLKALLKPMMLRRLKEDVEKSLAPKEETVVEVELTNIQKKYYRAILERNFTFLTKGNCYSNIPNLMNTMMELRKCCIHPFLINGAEEQIINDYKTQHEETLEGHLYAMIQASGKLVLMDKLLPRLRTGGHRVLVFSQMVRCLDILEDYLVQKRYPYERLDGRVRGNLRQAAIDRFCKPDSDRFVFLLCTRAGGLGINLTAADTVIIFDSDWNPQNDLQAQARCHRIGQSKAVKVYRLICRNTYEREMFDKASLKLGLDKAVLQSMSMSMKDNVGMNQQMSKKEIEDLLRKGAYGALMEDDNAGDKFCEEDIDQILQRRTQVITLESGTKGSTFSKATFASASTRSDIEIDDPNFWEKWAKKANLDVDELKTRNELIIQEPRRRTQTRRFGTDDLIDLSDLETSDEDDENISSRTRASRKGSKNRSKGRGRDRDDDFMEDAPPGNWTRAECYKMEKGLLTFGWGRWDECMAIGQFRRRMSHKDCEEISRTILLYCLLHYKGDEKIKSFIWDLICPNYDGEERIHKNHSESETTVEQDLIFDGFSTDGLSAPVPRGRKGKKIKKETKTVDQIIEECEWTKEEVNNPDSLLNDEIYKRHLNRHSNKVLLRVRLLYYLRHEIIGDLHDQVLSGRSANEIPLFVPPADGEPPTPWWDQELDKSLLLGIYKHGFERYNIMRQDPLLCFLLRCGPPDGAALLAELNPVSNEDDMEESSIHKDKDEEMDPLSPSNEHEMPRHIPNNYLPQHGNMLGFEMGVIHFPSVTDVNTRVRRLVTAFQRNNKKLEIRNAQKARKIERREKFEAAIREREMKKRELQQRKWSRREEADFYRTISSFGVEFNEEKKEYNWSRFRGIARLERKYDETLAEYYKCFYAMCKRVCGRELTEEEEQLSMNVEPISEERASRCLQRVELLNKIREEILCNPDLEERLKLCQPSMDLPDWWVCGKHDKDLLIGAAKHGLSRMDYHLLHDPNLSFKDVLKNIPNAKALQIGNMLSAPLGCSSPLNIYHTDDNILLKDENLAKLKEESAISADELALKDNAKPTLTSATESPVKLEVAASVKGEEAVEQDKEVAMDTSDIPDIKSEVSGIKSEKETEVEVKAISEQEIAEATSNQDETVNREGSVIQLTTPKTEDESKLSETEPDKSVDEPMSLDTSNELKIDEDVKMEDEETDIEMDPRKEDEEMPSVKSDKEEDKADVKPEVQSQSDGIEKDQKYDCDTDTESKSEVAAPALEPEESPLVKMEKAINNPEKCEASLSEKLFMKVKHEELMYEDGMRDRFNIQKMLPKDDPLHSHVDDSQMIAILQGCMSQNDDVMSQASFNLETEMGEPTVAQLLAFTNGNAVRWPKDKVLQIRLEHIVHAVEKNEWPIIRHTFLPTFPSVPQSTTPVPHPPVVASPVSHRASPVPSVSSQGHSGEVTPQATPEHTPQRETILPDIPTPTPPEFNVMRKSPLHIPPPPATESSRHRRRRRRRRFEIEAERAKLRQLLSHNMQQQQQQQHHQQLQHVQQFLASSNLRSKLWDEHVENKMSLPNVPSPAPPVPTASPTIPPPAHQNSSPRMSTSLGSLDLSVKPNITPPTPFTPLPMSQKAKTTQPVETPASVSGSPSSPIDLSASSSGTPAAHQGSSSSHHNTSTPKGHSRPKEKRGARGGSRIDALALNLQARKQQQLMQEQHHPLADIGSMVERAVEKNKDHGDIEESRPSMRHHSSHHHSERRNLEEEEVKLRKKRLQYSEESVRKALNRGFDLTPAPAHSSFLNPTISGSSGRMNLGSSKSEEHSSGTNPLLDPSSLMHHDFKKWIDEHPELVAANPNLVAAAAAAMAFSPVSSFPSHTELLELPEGRRRGRRPRLDPTKLDYDKVTGEENVSVINRLTGKKITGSKAPPLKYLAEWLDKNPMFDVDPKWGPLVREKGNLPNNMSKRIVTPSEKRGRRTAASLLASAHQNVVPPVTTMSFPSTGLNPLNFANTGMLGSFPNMKFFMDPPKSSVSSTTTTPSTSTTTTNPIFLPFGGLAGMGLTNPLFGFPGFNFPGLQGSSPLAGGNLSSKDHGKDSDKSRSDKDTSRKNSSASSSATSVNMSANTNLPQSSLPFLYPPGLLYNPLGLGGFTLPPNLPASFGSFTQSGLVNGLGLSNPLFTTSSLNTSLSSSMTAATTVTTPASHSILSSTPSITKTVSHTSPGKLSLNHSSSHYVADGQETDDESLKSLMGNHEDDDDDLDEGKMETFDNPEDSDREGFRDANRHSPAPTNSSIAVHVPPKTSQSDSECVNLAKTNSETSLELPSKSRGTHDDPTSDSTDTESKHS